MPIRENTFARRAREQQKELAQQRERKQAVVRDAQPTVEEQLVRLEEDIRRLKVEFDIYFNGAAKRPPYDTKARVETLIKRLGDDRTFTYAQRYQYNSLVARYTAFRDLWRRTIQDREEGRGPAAAAAASRQAEQQGQARESQRSTFVCADARADVPTVKSLYDALVAAKRQCGESVDDFSFAQFHRTLAAKTEALKEKLDCERVCYSVVTEGGRVTFKAKADR